MTTYINNTATCGACGHIFTCEALMSTNAFGSADLDTRPPEMRRSTMRVWLTRCPSCNYCANGIDWFKEEFRPVMESAEYRSQFADARYPELASRFICHAMLMDVIGECKASAWSQLRAAWALDDAEKDELARLWRGKAADGFIAVMPAGPQGKEQPGAREALISDCLRRAGRGNEALAILDSAPTQIAEEAIRKILNFERTLILQGDTACHLISEAMAAR